MPSNNGVKASLICAGSSLVEYGTENQGNVTTCWVASEVGKAFVVACEEYGSVRDLRQKSRLESRLYIDGLLVSDWLFADNKRNLTLDYYEHRLDNGTKKAYPFMFSNVILTDDETLHPNVTADQVGSIVVEFYHVIKTGVIGRLPSAKKELPVAVHERSKKLVTHKATFGTGYIRNDNSLLVKARPYDELNPGPIAVFKFLYRPHDLLVAQDIIPSVSQEQVEGNKPVPTQTNSLANGQTRGLKDEPVDDVQSEIIKLEMEQKSILERLSKLKRKSEADKRVTNKVKKEKRHFNPLCDLKIDRNGVIDLTDD